MKFGQAHVLDLLRDMGPVDIVHPLPAPEAAQQVSLMLRPGQDIAFVETVRHEPHRTARRDACQQWAHGRGHSAPEQVIATGGKVSLSGVAPRRGWIEPPNPLEREE
ncbi:MAG: hypothetical protein QOG73_2398 [Acetobacteraceae bacterium]|nr:hypothetical protein [Acetobacteraceae bacterium]